VYLTCCSAQAACQAAACAVLSTTAQRCSGCGCLWLLLRSVPAACRMAFTGVVVSGRHTESGEGTVKLVLSADGLLASAAAAATVRCVAKLYTLAGRHRRHRELHDWMPQNPIHPHHKELLLIETHHSCANMHGAYQARPHLDRTAVLWPAYQQMALGMQACL
jgi:hypothetical protein